MNRSLPIIHKMIKTKITLILIITTAYTIACKKEVKEPSFLKIGTYIRSSDGSLPNSKEMEIYYNGNDGSIGKVPESCNCYYRLGMIKWKDLTKESTIYQDLAPNGFYRSSTYEVTDDGNTLIVYDENNIDKMIYRFRN